MSTQHIRQVLDWAEAVAKENGGDPVTIQRARDEVRAIQKAAREFFSFWRMEEDARETLASISREEEGT